FQQMHRSPSCLIRTQPFRRYFVARDLLDNSTTADHPSLETTRCHLDDKRGPSQLLLVVCHLSTRRAYGYTPGQSCSPEKTLSGRPQLRMSGAYLNCSSG